jgi:hypothetical protein
MPGVQSIVWFLLLLWLAWRFPVKQLGNYHKPFSVVLLLCKIAGAILLVYLYTWYYPEKEKADIYRFYSDGIAMFELRKENPGIFWKNMFGLGNDFEYDGAYFHSMNNWVHPHGNRMYNDNRMVIRLHALMAFITDRTLLNHAIAFAGIAYIASIWLVLNLARLLSAPFKPLLVTCFLFPGLFIWGTGPMKETLVLLFLALFFSGINLLMKNSFSWKGLLFSGLGFGLIWFTKFYIIACLFPFLLIWIIWEKTNKTESVRVKGFIFTALTCILLGILTAWIFDFGIWRTIAYKQNNFMNLAISENSGSLTEHFYLEGTAPSILSALPYAWFKSFLMPLPHQISSLLFLAPMLENILLLLALGLLIFKKRLRLYDINSWLCLFFLLAFFGILGLTTPVLGGLFRYKIPAWPILAATFWHLYSALDIKKNTKQ